MRLNPQVLLRLKVLPKVWVVDHYKRRMDDRWNGRIYGMVTYYFGGNMSPPLWLDHLLRMTRSVTMCMSWMLNFRIMHSSLWSKTSITNKNWRTWRPTCRGRQRRTRRRNLKRCAPSSIKCRQVGHLQLYIRSCSRTPPIAPTPTPTMLCTFFIGLNIWTLLFFNINSNTSFIIL